jgi:HK97 family phage major capsid protein
MNELEIQEQRRALIAQASAITSNPDSTRAQRQHASSLLAEAASLRTDAQLFAKMNSLAESVGLPTREFDETRAAEKYDREFRAYVRGGGSTTRGAALDSTSSGAPFIPALWAQQFNQKLVSYSGVLEAGATVITTTAGGSWLMPSIDDTNSNNTGVRLEDSVAMSNFFPVVSLNTVPSFKYVSNGILVSNSLVSDIGFPI